MRGLRTCNAYTTVDQSKQHTCIHERPKYLQCAYTTDGWIMHNLLTTALPESTRTHKHVMYVYSHIYSWHVRVHAYSGKCHFTYICTFTSHIAYSPALPVPDPCSREFTLWR